LLYVPKNVRLELPLHSLSAMSADGVDLGRTLVILEPGAEATMLSETASGTHESAGLHCGSIELIVEQGARLRYVNLQNWGTRFGILPIKRRMWVGRRGCSGQSELWAPASRR